MLEVKEFEAQYKNHLSGYITWEPKGHADKWLLFENNIGEKLSIDEIAVTNGELYTVVTNKKAKGGKGSLVAITAGTKASEVIAVLKKIPIEIRNTVLEVTLDMSNAMDAIIKGSFPKVTIVTDRFHVQQLVSEAVQEIRILLRKKAIKEESRAILRARKNKKKKAYQPPLYENDDTKKQLLARSRYLLFKPTSKWTEKQKLRAAILFKETSYIKSIPKISKITEIFFHKTHHRIFSPYYFMLFFFFFSLLFYFRYVFFLALQQ